MSEAWYRLDVDETVVRLGTDPRTGLSESEAARRLRAAGENRWQDRKSTGKMELFLGQFRDFMVLVLLAATAVSYLLGEKGDALTIALIVFVNAFLGFYQELRAEESLAALRRLAAPQARVLRGGRSVVLPAERVVVGDVLLLEAGDRLSADVRLLEAHSLEVEEAVLTGESVPVPKTERTLSTEGLGPGDQRNMAFQGTLVTRGRGRGVVVATGMRTEMGQIAGMIQESGFEPTPLQRRLEGLGRVLVYACLGISALVAVVGILRGEPPYRMFLTGVSLAVAAIPEGLPAIVTVSLAVGVQRMIRRRAILRRLPAVETLGCATTICTDKTGTLTENRLRLEKAFTGGSLVRVEELPGVGAAFDAPGGALSGNLLRALRRLLLAGTLGGDARPVAGGREPEIQGDPTEAAIVRGALWSGLDLDRVFQEYPRLAERPFDPETRSMSVTCEGPDGPVLFLKGDLEVVLGAASRWLGPEGEQPLDAGATALFRRVAEEMAGEGLRVLAIAEGAAAEGERNLLLLGIVGLTDPPRRGVARALTVCREAGIRTIMVTGDHPATALAIARRIGLGREEGEVLTGSEIDNLNDEGLAARLASVRIVARASPRHKLRLVRALRRRGEVVAMTGDGVNDAPAIKEADIGVAMGLSGTDLTKETSAMVLTDDNFGTIVAAVEEGRAIYENIRKAVRYLLSGNVGELLVMFLASLMAWPAPLLPIQILWVNLVTDGLPALALALDPGDEEAMRRPPRPPGEGFFARGLTWKILTRGIWIGAVTLTVFRWGLLSGDLARARTMAFAVLVGSQLFHVFDARAENRSILRVPVWNNPFLILGVLSSVSLLLLAIYLPTLAVPFQSRFLPFSDWLVIFLLSASGTAGLEIRRRFLRLGSYRTPLNGSPRLRESGKLAGG